MATKYTTRLTKITFRERPRHNHEPQYARRGGHYNRNVHIDTEDRDLEVGVGGRWALDSPIGFDGVFLETVLNTHDHIAGGIYVGARIANALSTEQL